MFFSNTKLLTQEPRHYFCQHRVSLVETRRMNYNLTLKGQLENLTSGQGHDLTGKGHVAYQSVRNVEPNTPKAFSAL